jgi:toxin ParE1/3/4
VARIRWTNQALADLEAIGNFIARDAPSVAQIFVDHVFEAVKRLEIFPRSGRVVPEIGQEDIREILYLDFGYFSRNEIPGKIAADEGFVEGE